MNARAFAFLPASLLALIIGVFVLVPNAMVWLAFKREAFLGGELWRLVTFPFVHVSASHLFENIVAFFVATLLAYEAELTVAQYALAVVFSTLVVAAIDVAWLPTLVLAGASSAIFAVYGAFAMKGSMFVQRRWLIVILGATIMTKYGVAAATGSIESGIMLQTLLHVAGFLSGLAVIFVCGNLARANKRRMLT